MKTRFAPESFFKLSIMLAVITLAVFSIPSVIHANSHGQAHHAELQYKSGFTHFDYANPNAKKGGRLVLSAVGGFDSLNPYALKGETPLLLGSLVFESITDRSLSEPFAQYGLLAKEILPSKDNMSITFVIRDGARFSDNTPLTPEDVKFSFEMLTSKKSQPFYRFYYNDIKKVSIDKNDRVTFHFATINPELKLIIGELPVLSRRFYTQGDFAKDFKKKIIGSGPYIVSDFKLGKYIIYKRNKAYWGKDIAVNTGRFNFDEIMVKYYKNRTTELEGLKAGEFDFLAVTSSKDWARSLNGPNYDNGKIIKEMLPHSNNAGMQGFAMNQRNPLFKDIRTRRALALSFDFEWSNKNLFYNQYKPNASYFAGSELAATGLPSADELKILTPLKEFLPKSVFTTPMAPVGSGFKDIRSRLRVAKKLLADAGWKMKNGHLFNSDGKQFKFTILLSSDAFGRIIEPWFNNLKKLGIKADFEVKDPSIYIEKLQQHNWEMIVLSVGQSQSPGNEQRDYWHSETADTIGSRNRMGIKNKAIDKLVELVIEAKTRGKLVTATHALDRALWHGHYMVPNWYIDKFRVTYWNRFGKPEKLPKYYNPMDMMQFWWAKQAK